MQEMVSDSAAAGSNFTILPGNTPLLNHVRAHRQTQLCAVLWTLTSVERQTEIIRRERDLAALWEIEDVAF